MSLINDALKRAANPPRPAGGPVPPGMQPVPDSPRQTGPLPVILCIVGVGSLLIAGGLWLKSKGTSRQGAPLEAPSAKIAATVPASHPQPIPAASGNANPLPVAAAPASPVPPAASPAVQAALPAPAQKAPPSPEIATAPVVPKVEPPPPQSPAVAAAAPAVARPATHAAPILKLQAIYYRLQGPTVVINGKTLEVGDTIDGARLVTIERNWVEVEHNGTKQRLTIR